MTSSLKQSSFGNSLWTTLEGQVADGKYHLGRLISSGSFGGVFEADEVVGDQLIRRVALKLITPDSELSERQMQELVLACSLDHPHILRCFSPGACVLNGVPLLYIVMELASESLASRVADNLLDAAAASLLAEGVLSGLAYLSGGDRPMVHRDVKPANILLANGAWKLADFGLLRGIGRDRVAHTRTLLGTAEYAPPEAYEGIVSPSWDIWSLGVVLVEGITGCLPFDEPSPQELQRAIMQDPARHLDDVPDHLRELVRGCLIKDRMRRWSAEEALDVLRGNVPAPMHPTGMKLRAADPAERRARYTFRFKFDQADTVADLIRLCEEYPVEATDYFADKYITKWLREGMDDAGLAREAQFLAQSYASFPERGLELLIRNLRSTLGMQADPRIRLENPRLDFGLRTVGEQACQTIRYFCDANRLVWGKTSVMGNLPGIIVDPTFGIAGAPVAVRLDAADTKAGYYEGEVLLHVAGLPDPLHVPVSYSITPLKVTVSPLAIEFGAIDHGVSASREIIVEASSLNAIVKGQASIIPPTPGMAVDNDFLGSEVRLTVTVDSLQLESGREYVRRVQIRTNGATFEVPIRLRTSLPIKNIALYTAGAILAGGGICALARTAVVALGDTRTHWFLNYASGTQYDMLFRVVGNSLVAFAAGWLFRRFARWKWPLWFEQRQRQNQNVAVYQPSQNLFDLIDRDK